MKEKPKPHPELTKLTNALVRLQEIKKMTEEASRSVDGSDKLVGSALIAGLSKSAIKDSTSSS